jgi:hypothetical protein
MDAGIAVQPVTGLALTELARPAAVAAQGTVPTDLPTAKAVNPPPQAIPAPRAVPARNEKPPSNPATVNITRNFLVDARSGEIVYRVMDVRTQQVLLQVPDTALLRSQAFAQTVAGRANNIPIRNQTDIRA